MTSKRSAQRAHEQDVGLTIIDIADAELARLPHRVREAREAQVDGEDARVRESPRGADRVPAGAAARDEDARGRVGNPGQVRVRKLASQESRDRRLRDVPLDAHPPRIRIGFVLAAHRRRDFVDDLRQRLDRAAKADLLQRLPDLPRRERSERRRPRAPRRSRRKRQCRTECRKWPIARVDAVPVERHRVARVARRGDRVAQRLDVRTLGVGLVVHVLGVEALVRDRRDGRQRQRDFRGGAAIDLEQEAAARESDEPLDEEIRHDHGLEQALEDHIAEQVPDGVPRRRPLRRSGGRAAQPSATTTRRRDASRRGSRSDARDGPDRPRGGRARGTAGRARASRRDAEDRTP